MLRNPFHGQTPNFCTSFLSPGKLSVCSESLARTFTLGWWSVWNNNTDSNRRYEEAKGMNDGHRLIKESVVESSGRRAAHDLQHKEYKHKDNDRLRRIRSLAALTNALSGQVYRFIRHIRLSPHGDICQLQGL